MTGRSLKHIMINIMLRTKDAVQVKFIYIDSNDVNIYLQKRSVEMNPMARDVNRHRQLEEEHPPRIERT